MNHHDEESFMHCDFKKVSNEKLIDSIYNLGSYENCILSFEMESFNERVILAKGELLKRLG